MLWGKAGLAVLAILLGGLGAVGYVAWDGGRPMRDTGPREAGVALAPARTVASDDATGAGMEADRDTAAVEAPDPFARRGASTAGPDLAALDEDDEAALPLEGATTVSAGPGTLRIDDAGGVQSAALPDATAAPGAETADDLAQAPGEGDLPDTGAAPEGERTARLDTGTDDDAGRATDARDTDLAETGTVPAEDAGPSFDLVRVEPDGFAQIAGRAKPGETVSVFVDGEATDEIEADGSGAFVAFLSLGRSERPRVISFETDGAPASGRLIVAPNPGRPLAGRGDRADAGTAGGADAEADTTATDTAAVETTDIADADADTTGGADTTGQTDGPAPSGEVALLDRAPAAPGATGATDDAPAPAAEAPAAEAPSPDGADAAPAVLLADDDGMTLLQTGDDAPEAVDSIAIDAIGYDAEGDVLLAGRGSLDRGTVRVYLDGRPLTEAPVGPDGAWRMTLPEVDSGTYTLRVDEIGADGRVASRAETPFRREPATAVAAASGETGVITVQPGNTLWGLSADAYGEGILFVSLFAANADRIRDPNLIYPGQIFDLPEADAAAAEFDDAYRKVYRP